MFQINNTYCVACVAAYSLCCCVEVSIWVVAGLLSCCVAELLSYWVCCCVPGTSPLPGLKKFEWLNYLATCYLLPARSISVLLGYLLPAQSVASCLLGILATAVLHLPTLLLYWLSGWCMCNDIITTDTRVILSFHLLCVMYICKCNESLNLLCVMNHL